MIRGIVFIFDRGTTPGDRHRGSIPA